MRSELIDDRHLARRAVIYIRQSTPHQVLTNQESLRLQYDLRRRAQDALAGFGGRGGMIP
jgi:hypothetical protein